MGIAATDDLFDPDPGHSLRHRFQLPPIGIDAEIIDVIDHGGDRIRTHRPVARGDDFQQQFMARCPAGVEQAQQLGVLPRSQVGGVIGMIEDETFDDLVTGPFGQRVA